MTPGHPLRPSGGEPPGSAVAPAETAAQAGHGLVPAARPDEEEERTFTSPISRLPVELDVVVPVRDFRVRHLLALQAGHLIESHWGNGEDLPLTSGNVQLAWSEFEVMDTQLAVRITRLT